MHAKSLNIDSNRIGVAGVSAGGGLTAALSLLARDRKYPSICLQMPLYPMIDDRNNTHLQPMKLKKDLFGTKGQMKLAGKCI